MRDVREVVRDISVGVAAAGLAPAGGGNVSVRNEDGIWITRSGLRLADCTPQDVVEAGAPEGHGLARPSSERRLHAAAYESADVRAVVHTHGVASVAAGLLWDRLPAVHYSMGRLAPITGVIPVIPYHPFGSEQLADEVARGIALGHRAFLLRHHGAVVAVESASQANELAELLEWNCQVALAARAPETRELSESQIAAYIERSVALRYGDAQ